MKKNLLALALLSTMAAPAFAQSSDHDRIAALEAQVQLLQAEIRAMKGSATPTADAPAIADSAAESDLEALAAAPEEATNATEPDVAALAADNGASNPNAFNPAISIILNGSYSRHSLDPETYARAGFPLVGEGGPGADGFSLGESEIALSSNIDDKFYGQLTLAIDGEDGIGVEEAYIDTTALPNGFSLRMGRFFSNIGYLNNHHAHTDNFFDRPLAYQAFLGNQYGDDGVQLRWVAPTAMFIELGGELLRGQNFPSGGAAHKGIGTKTVFAHFGGDVGTENSWLAGVSALRTRADGAEDGFSGDATLYVADGTWKWAPNGNTKDGGLTVRGEYFLEDRSGTYIALNDPLVAGPWNGQRRGGYLEGIYRVNRNWDVGYRYDRLWSNADSPLATDFDPFRHSAELTWRNSEFSLLRLQFSRDTPNDDDRDSTVTLQYQTALGAHGAHKF